MEIKYNYRFGRWEVFGENAVTRAGERQPSFVSANIADCNFYILNVEGYHE